MIWLNGVYIGCTLFSLTITVLDFLGFLGGSQDSDSGGGDASGDGAEDAGMRFDTDFPVDETNTGKTSPESITHTAGKVAVLSVLSYLRSLVYFCLGFGPTGWVAIAMGKQCRTEPDLGGACRCRCFCIGTHVLSFPAYRYRFIPAFGGTFLSTSHCYRSTNSRHDG